MNTTTHRQTDTEYLLTPDDPNRFTCGIDEQEIRLTVIAELIDHQAHGLPFPEGYPIGIQFAIVPHAEDVHPDMQQQIRGDADYTFTELDLYTYGGGVTVQRAQDMIGEPAERIDYVVDDDYYMFATLDDAADYIDQAGDTMMPQLMTMVGFELDKRVNRLGATGWDRLTEWCVDPAYNGLRPGGN